MECEKFHDKVLKDRNLLLHLRNIHGTIVVKYSPPRSLHKFLYGFCRWRIMLSSIYLCNETFFIIFFTNTEYYIIPIPFLSQGNIVSLSLEILMT
jgi:hypothetical protein